MLFRFSDQPLRGQPSSLQHTCGLSLCFGGKSYLCLPPRIRGRWEKVQRYVHLPWLPIYTHPPTHLSRFKQFLKITYQCCAQRTVAVDACKTTPCADHALCTRKGPGRRTCECAEGYREALGRTAEQECVGRCIYDVPDGALPQPLRFLRILSRKPQKINQNPLFFD